MNPSPESGKTSNDNLVAYLDGELPVEEAAAVEQQLGRSDKLRVKAHELERAWDMLDYLPRHDSSGGFTNDTVARFETERAAHARKERRQLWLLGSLWATALCMIAAFSGFMTYRPAPTADQVKLSQYEFIYEGIEDIEFLKALSEPELFGDVE